MRSDRKEAQRRQKEADRGNRVYRVLSVIYTLILISFIIALIWLNVLPTKYLYGLIGIVVLVSIFIVPVMFSKNGVKRRKTIASVFSVILIAAYGVGTYVMADTIDFFNDITVDTKKQATEDYYVIINSQDTYTNISGLSGKNIGTYTVTDTNYSKAKSMLQDAVNSEFCYIDDLESLFSGLPAGSVETVDEQTGQSEIQEYEAVFVSSASYELMKSEMESLENNTKILYTVSVPLPEGGEAKQVDVTRESFNIFVSGLDVEGDISTVSRSDVNIIVTVNPRTHKILMTSIPRDYYVNLPSKNAMDKLTHSGLYGISETIGAVEEMMGIKINYYVKVNYTTIVKLVDAIGGIDIDSPYGFVTHKMGDLSGITFVEGQNHLDGRMALAYSRERASWVDGDMRRNENQQLILEAIIEKATNSTTILTSYTSILDAVRGNVETNFTQDEITSIIKMQLDGMPGWDIEKTALKGKNDYLVCYALGFAASVVDQDPEMIVQAGDLIAETMEDEENITDESGEN